MLHPKRDCAVQGSLAACTQESFGNQESHSLFPARSAPARANTARVSTLRRRPKRANLIAQGECIGDMTKHCLACGDEGPYSSLGPGRTVRIRSGSYFDCREEAPRPRSEREGLPWKIG